MSDRTESVTGRHVAMFLPSLVAGGVARTYVDLANGFSARGCHVDLVLCRADGPHLERVDPAVKIIPLAQESRAASRRRLAGVHPGPWRELLRPVLLSLSDPPAYRCVGALANYLTSARPDALLSGKTHSNLAALWARELSQSRTRVVVSERTHLSEQISRKRAGRWRGVAPLVARMYPRADAITSVSDGVSDDLAAATGIDRKRIDTLYNPIDLERIRRLAAEPANHAWLDGGEPVVLATGRLVRQKGFTTLLEAFAKIGATNPGLRLVILGEGDERKRLTSAIERLGLRERVSLPGYVANPYAFMSRARVFVLSSVWEGLPGALIEALACGCPVVSTDCPSGPREILADGRYGDLVPVGDPDALAHAILRGLAHPPAPEPLRDRAEGFAADAAIDRYLRVLLDC